MKTTHVSAASQSVTSNRRQFLSQVAAWSAGLLAAPPIFQVFPQSLNAATAEPFLSVGKGTDYEALLVKVFEPLGGIAPFVKKGARVVIKPNMSWDRKPELAANTHPLLVKAMARLCLQAGASKVMVFDRTCQDMRLCYASCGTPAAIESLKDPRVTCTFVDDRKFVPVKIQKGKGVTEWEFYKDAITADCYINMPIAKDHKLARLTLGLKNIMGILGGKRNTLHPGTGQQSLTQKIADFNTVLCPTLTVMDATRILLRNGPSGGKPEDVVVKTTVAAGTDIVALDALGLELLGREPDTVKKARAIIKNAELAGLGKADYKSLVLKEIAVS
ncbi:MAG: DUF362 domain-containing protein [Verrucomicrobia bacterium]|nr:DUF362 domain-containing protein [Verrucomicrobiota bacterium]